MQIIIFLIGMVIWLVVYWAGSIALEATGMERSKARFQTLSAISGTGFTTSEAESVVNHPQRRKIVSRLIVFGTTGLLGTIVALILFIRVGLEVPSPIIIIGIIITLAIIILIIKVGVINKVTGSIVGRLRRQRLVNHLYVAEVTHKTGQFGVIRLSVGTQASETNLTIQDTRLREQGLTILAIERNNTAIPFPEDKETILSGDYLLCYGNVAEMM